MMSLLNFFSVILVSLVQNSENKKEKHLNMVIQIRFRVTNILFPDVYRILYYRRFACDIIENHSVVL